MKKLFINNGEFLRTAMAINATLHVRDVCTKKIVNLSILPASGGQAIQFAGGGPLRMTEAEVIN